MDFGNSPRVKLTEDFMKNFSKFNPDAIVQLETAEYNKVYEAVHTLIGYINIKHFLADKIEVAQTAKGGQAEVRVMPKIAEDADEIILLTKDLLRGANLCMEKQFVVQPFLAIVKKHSDIINKYKLLE